MAVSAGLSIPEELGDALRRLGRHYIAARYPDAHASGPPGTHYGRADALQSLDDAHTVLRAVDEIWVGLSEFIAGWAKGNPLVREVAEHGVVLVGDDFFRSVAGA
jgi:hypothetical protein